MVMTGMRVQVGTQAIERAPSYVEVFGRTMQINLTRARWFDFPFTREEALQADKKLSIFSKIKTVQWLYVFVFFYYLMVFLVACIDIPIHVFK